MNSNALATVAVILAFAAGCGGPLRLAHPRHLPTDPGSWNEGASANKAPSAGSELAARPLAPPPSIYVLPPPPRR